MSEAVTKAIAEGQPAAAESVVDIPVTVIVRCPLVGMRMRRICEHCPTCEHFRGLGDRFPGGAPGMAFSARFHIRCAAEPVRRELFEVA